MARRQNSRRKSSARRRAGHSSDRPRRVRHQYGEALVRHTRQDRQEPDRKAHRQAGIDPRFFSEVKAFSAFNQSEKIDILMTHAGPQCAELQTGSIILAKLAERIRPTVHFFGHHHQVIGPCQGPGHSLLVGLEHLDFNKNGELKEGAWGILTLAENLANFVFSSPKNLPFLKTIKRETYRSLLNCSKYQP